MRDIDICGIKAVFFDRGKVTHDCRTGSEEHAKEQESARELSIHLEKIINRKIDIAKISELPILPWKNSFAHRDSRGYETPLEEFFEVFLAAIGTTATDGEVCDMIDVFCSAYIKVRQSQCWANLAHEHAHRRE